MRILAVVAVTVGCARPRSPLPLPSEPAEIPADATRYYTIWLGGARVGTATEHEHWTSSGMTLARNEVLHFLRGDTPVDLTTAITIDASLGLTAQRVRWTETGGESRGAEAVRTATGWQLSTGGSLTMPAVPAELLPLLVRRDGHFDGPIFLPARGFVEGDGRIDPVGPVGQRLVARVALAAGAIVEATIDLAPDGSPSRVVDGEGVIALRASPSEANEPFAAVDLIAATTLPITGVRDAALGAAHHGAHLVLVGDIVLPTLPGQSATPVADGIDLELGPSASHAPRELGALVSAVRARITPTLGAGPASTRDAGSATAGDCTTFALAYAALATSRGIPTRIVTGLRIDGDRLVRHRWAVSFVDNAWIEVDAAFDQVPAGGNLIGLAIHDADDAGLIAGEAALTQVRAARWGDR